MLESSSFPIGYWQNGHEAEETLSRLPKEIDKSTTRTCLHRGEQFFAIATEADGLDARRRRCGQFRAGADRKMRMGPSVRHKPDRKLATSCAIRASPVVSDPGHRRDYRIAGLRRALEDPHPPLGPDREACGQRQGRLRDLVTVERVFYQMHTKAKPMAKLY